jgi:hypothetical protein
MYSLSNNNIKYSCSICDKKYTRKSSLDKHNILCEFLLKSKREKIIDNEEAPDIPTYTELVNIVQELSLNYNYLKEKMKKMEKWIDKKKKKINVIDWLQSNRKPQLTFDIWINNLNIKNQEIEYLMENNIFQTINKIWEQMNNNDNIIIPIVGFSQKNNLLYIYNSNNQWINMKTEDFQYLLHKLQHKLLEGLSNWRQNNLQEINNNDSISILYNKMIIKIMNISLTPNNCSKIHANLYNYLKMDLKNMIEYEFEF